MREMWCCIMGWRKYEFDHVIQAPVQHVTKFFLRLTVIFNFEAAQTVVTRISNQDPVRSKINRFRHQGY